MDYDIRPHLLAYAAQRLGRAIDITDPEVAEFEEALLREVFRQGGRTNPGGYYLNVIMTGYYAVDNAGQRILDEEGRPKLLLPAKLKSPNDLMRLELKQGYRSYRNDWYRIIAQNVPRKLRPKKPLSKARVKFEIFTSKTQKHRLDAEAKYSAMHPLLAALYGTAEKYTATKPLLDSVQSDTVFSTTGKDTTRKGVGILHDDSDGEHRTTGVIKQLEVFQTTVPGPPKLRLIVEEVS